MRIKRTRDRRGLRQEGVQTRGRQAVLESRTWGDLQEALDSGSRGQPGGIQPTNSRSATWPRTRSSAATAIRSATVSFRSTSIPAAASPCRKLWAPSTPRPSPASPASFSSIGSWPPSRRKSSSSRSYPTVPTSLNGERIPGVALPHDPGEDVVVAEEMDELHYIGFTEEYIQTPATTNRQLGIAVTKEAVFFDRTGLVLDRELRRHDPRLRKEKNLILTFIGADQTFQEKRTGDSAAVSLATYYAADDNARWTNHLDGNPLNDWTNMTPPSRRSRR